MTGAIDRAYFAAGAWGERAALMIHVATQQTGAPLMLRDEAAGDAYALTYQAAHYARPIVETLRSTGAAWADGEVVVFAGVEWTCQRREIDGETYGGARVAYMWSVRLANGRHVWRFDRYNGLGGVSVLFVPWNGGHFSTFGAALAKAQA